MKFKEWVDYVKSVGGVDTDGAYGKQCVDLHNHFCINVLGLQKGRTGASRAKYLINNEYLKENCELIKNYPAFIPQRGDIAVWTGSEYGHVAICLDGCNINQLKTIDQNWHLDRKLTEETHDYFKLAPLYFFRPYNQTNIADPVPAKTYIYLPEFVERWRVYPLDKRPTVGNECGFLYPRKFGGLEYKILYWSIPDKVCVIETRDYGKVQIYVGSDTDVVFK